MTLKSGKVYSNTGAPNNADGINGDIYMQLDGFKTTYRKENGAWTTIGSTLGAIPEFVSGVGAPSNSLGTDGQYYRNANTQDIYYKQGGVWNLVGNLDNTSISAELAQAGIGKYLGTAPNVVTTGSMNDLILAGEYYVTGSVTDMPPDVNSGYVKVWGLDSNNVAQIMQRTIGSSVFEIHLRQSSGGVFGAWTTTASLATTTLAGIVEKATQAELNAGVANVWPDAATIFNGFNFNGAAKGHITLPSFLGGFTIQWGTKIYGELPASVVTVTDTFDTVMDSIYWAGAFPYNPNLSGQMAFIVTVRDFTVSNITVDMVELSGSGHQFSAGFTWIALGVDS